LKDDMKDYYRILGLEPGAEAKEIHAAYRRLMKEYHPDTLDAARRQDPDVQQMVKDLNEAYEVLRDSAKRRSYDEQYQWQAMLARSGPALDNRLEKLRYLIRCGKTKRTFIMHLVRPEGSTGPFVVLGFEPLPEMPLLTHAATSQTTIWERIAGVFGRGRRPEETGSAQPQSEPHDLSEEEIQALLDGSVGLSMGDIDWNYFACPDCGSVVQNENGTLATWSGCDNCGHIKCVGSVERTRRGIYSVCPWCGRRNRVTRSVPLGKADHLTLKGRTDHHSGPDAAVPRRRFDPKTGRRLEEPE
jgi:hypothetical protein